MCAPLAKQCPVQCLKFTSFGTLIRNVPPSLPWALAAKSRGCKEGERQEGRGGQKEWRGRGQGRDQGNLGLEMPLRGLFSTNQPGQQQISGSLLVGLGCPYQSGKQPWSCPLVFLTDVDECTDADACGEARCKNLPGSYSCLCDEGYEFSSQEKACRGTHPQLPWALHTYTHTHMHHTHVNMCTLCIPVHVPHITHVHTTHICA